MKANVTSNQARAVLIGLLMLWPFVVGFWMHVSPTTLMAFYLLTATLSWIPVTLIFNRALQGR